MKSLQQICIDYVNSNGPQLLDTILKIQEYDNNDFDIANDIEETENYSTNINVEDILIQTTDDNNSDISITMKTFKMNKSKQKRRNPLRDYINSKRRKRFGSRKDSPDDLSKLISQPVNEIKIKEEIFKPTENVKIEKKTKLRESRAFTTTTRSRSLELKSLEKALINSVEPTLDKSLRLTHKPKENTKVVNDVSKPTTRLRSAQKTIEHEISTKIQMIQNDIKSKVIDSTIVDNTLVGIDQSSDSIDSTTSILFKKPQEKRRGKRSKEYIRHITKKKHYRTKARINYSEALVDEALMYEEILMDKEAQEQLVIATTIQNSKNTGSKPMQKTISNFSNYIYDEQIINRSKKQLPKNRNGSSSTNFLEKLSTNNEIKEPHQLNDISFDYFDKNQGPKKSKTSSVKQLSRQVTLIQKSNISKCVKPSSSSKSMLSEISITPITKSRKPEKVLNKSNVSLNDIKKTFKSNPDVVQFINSAVSIQLKSPITINSNDNKSLDITNAVKCTQCDQTFDDMKQLALHQGKHLRVITYKIGELQILNPKFRRGRMVPMGNQKCFRCLNCWRLHANSQSILEHWVAGKCDFYCSICGESFHHNPRLIRFHFSQVHGIRYNIPEEHVNPELAIHKHTMNENKLNSDNVGSNRPVLSNTFGIEDITKLKPGRVKCGICHCSFPNMHSRNSHMRLHKHQRDKDIRTPRSQTVIRNQQIQLSQKGSSQRRRTLSQARSKPLGQVIKHPSHQLKTLLQQSPKPFTTPFKPSQNIPIDKNKFDVNIKTELSEDSFSEFNSIDYPSDLMTDYTNILPMQSEIESSITIKSEPSTSVQPRLQVKKLTELQEPIYKKTAKNYYPQSSISTKQSNSFASSSGTYYPTSTPPMSNQSASIQRQHHYPMSVRKQILPILHQSTQQQPLPQQHHHVNQPPQQPHLPHFQISQVQQLQNSQYYNPVFVVQQQTSGIPVSIQQQHPQMHASAHHRHRPPPMHHHLHPVHQQPLNQQNMYHYPDEYNEYSTYYS